MFKRFISALILLMVATPVFGAAPELCGNGLDDPWQTGGSANGTKGSCPSGYADAIIGSGCDLLCPGGDSDNDGYTSNDCDQTRRDIYPGVVTSVGCSANYYRTCQTNGTFSSCTNADLCEATGTGVCKYIHCDTGNDTTGNGTKANPWKSLGMVAGGSSGAPAGAYSLNAGDAVYILGGTCSTKMTTYSSDYLAYLDRDGTQANPILIKRYPGSTAVLDITDGVSIRAPSWYRFDDLEFTSTRTATLNIGGISINQEDGLEVSRSYFRDMEMYSNNNNACIYQAGSNYSNIHHNWFKDCRYSVGTNWANITALFWMDDEGVGEGMGHHGDYNVFWYSTWDDTNNANCIRQKHGTNASDSNPDGHSIRYNYFVNCNQAIEWHGSNIRASHNLVWGPGTAFAVTPGDGGASHQQNEFTYNTIATAGDEPLKWRLPAYDGTESLTFKYNVVIDTRDSYVAGNWDGMIGIDGYGSDAEKAIFETNDYLVTDYNCFYNASATPVYSYFSINDLSERDEGGNYTFAQWQAAGYDTNSAQTNPTLDTFQRATVSPCLTWGWRTIAGDTNSTVWVGRMSRRGRYR